MDVALAWARHRAAGGAAGDVFAAIKRVWTLRGGTIQDFRGVWRAEGRQYDDDIWVVVGLMKPRSV